MPERIKVDGNEFTAAVADMRDRAVQRRGTVIDPKTAPKPINDSSETTFPDFYPRRLIRQMDDAEIEKVTKALLASMTFSEKCALLVSSTDKAPVRNGVACYLVGVPRLGVPEQRQHDGPAGILHVYETTNLPLGLSLASSFSRELAREYGGVLGREQRSIGSNCQLGCQYDLCRTPYFSRGKDTFGEDHFLTGELAVAQVEGLQAEGAVAMAKHLGGYCMNGDAVLWSEMDEQTFQTAYGYTFQQPAVRARMGSIMTSYNHINGYWAASSKMMQLDTARDLWNWKGCFTTDAGGNAECSVGLGTDVEMGTARNNEASCRAYIKAGLLTEAEIDEAVAHVLYSYGVAGYLGLVEVDELTGKAKSQPGRTDIIRLEDSYWQDRASGLLDKDNSVAEKVSLQGTILLKNNDHALPLKKEDYTNGKSLALIGYGAKYSNGGTGSERSFGVLEYMRSGEEALRELVGDDANIVAEVMDDKFGCLLPGQYVYQDEACTKNGWVKTYGVRLNDPNFAPPPGPPMDMGPPDMDEPHAMPDPEGIDPQSGVPLGGFGGGGHPNSSKEDVLISGHDLGEAAGVEQEINYVTGTRTYLYTSPDHAIFHGEGYTWTGWVKPPVDGEYNFVLMSTGGDVEIKVYDGDDKIASAERAVSSMGNGAWGWDFWDNDGLCPAYAKAKLQSGKAYKVVVTGIGTAPYKGLLIKLNWQMPGYKQEMRDRAVKAAESCDTVVYFTRAGLIGHFPSTSTVFDLSIAEKENIALIQKAVKARGGKFILVVCNRTAFTSEGNWLEDTDALVATFYNGQSGSTALMKLLTGEANFSAKTCLTFPKRSTDTLLSVEDEQVRRHRGSVPVNGSYTANFDEGLDYGYRWYLREDVEPAWPFGFGLSYTSFHWSDFKLRRENDQIKASLTVTNTGDMTGSEIVQLYLGPVQAPEYVHMPLRQLAAFARVEDLSPGESRQVEMVVPKLMLSYWDERQAISDFGDGTRGKWVTPDTPREVMLARSSMDVVYSETL